MLLSLKKRIIRKETINGVNSKNRHRLIYLKVFFIKKSTLHLNLQQSQIM